VIRLPAYEILFWVLWVCGALLVISCLASFVALRSAHASWRADKPAATAERLALIVLVPDLILFLLLLPPIFTKVLVASSVPGLVCLATVFYLRRGDRRRGHPSLSRRRILHAALASLAGSLLLLASAIIGVRAHQARAQRLHDAAVARGRSDQDAFAAVVTRDRGVAVVGETSTPPAQDDDAWMLVLDPSLAIERNYSPVMPKRQALFALAADGEDLVAGGRDDERPLWLRFDRVGDLAARKIWQGDGAVHAIEALSAGMTLVVGERSGAPFIASVEASGAERWSISPDLKGSLRAVATNGRRYLAAGPDDPLGMPGSTSVLAGGSIDGTAAWAKGIDRSEYSPTAHALAVMDGGAFLALGTTGEMPGRMADLWLARISEDGTVLEERTFGDAPGEAAGGLAVLGSRVFVAAYRFVPPREELWLFELDGKGNRVWERTYAASSHGRPLALAVTREGNLVLAGYREAADHHRDGWVGIFDSTGALLAQRTYP
jgi:hypothetical protein